MDLLISFAEHVHFGLNPLTDSPTWSKWGGLSAPVTGQLVVDLNNDGADDVVLESLTEQTTYILANRP